MVVLDLCYPSPSAFPESCLPLTQSSASSSCNKHKCIMIHSQSLHLFCNNFPTSLRSGFFLLVWSRQGIILMLFSWHRKSHSNFHTRFFSEFPCFQISQFLDFKFIHPGILVPRGCDPFGQPRLDPWRWPNGSQPLGTRMPPWYLMQYDWLVPSMRRQLIQDSFFPPGFRRIFRAG